MENTVPTTLERIYLDTMDRHWLGSFCLFALTAGIFTFIMNYFILSDDLLYQFYTEKFSSAITIGRCKFVINGIG